MHGIWLLRSIMRGLGTNLFWIYMRNALRSFNWMKTYIYRDLIQALLSSQRNSGQSAIPHFPPPDHCHGQASLCALQSRFSHKLWWVHLFSADHNTLLPQTLFSVNETVPTTMLSCMPASSRSSFWGRIYHFYSYFICLFLLLEQNNWERKIRSKCLSGFMILDTWLLIVSNYCWKPEHHSGSNCGRGKCIHDAAKVINKKRPRIVYSA